MEAGRAEQHHLVLILARDFASRLATPVFLVDAEGSVIYFNEAAERVLGRRFIEGVGMGADGVEHGVRTHRRRRGTRSRCTDLPLGVAILERHPDHRMLRIRSLDGTERRIEVDRLPAVRARGRVPRRDRDLLGDRGAERRLPVAPGNLAHADLGVPGLDRVARSRHDPLRRQHVVRRGARRRRRGDRARRRHGSTAPRRGADAGAGHPHRPAAHPPARRSPRGPRHVRADLVTPTPSSTSGDRPHRWPRSTSASRPTSRRRCSPCTCPRCPRASRFHDAPQAAVDDRIDHAHRRSDPAPGRHRRLPARVEGSRTLAYVTDHEPALGTDLDAVGTSWISGYALAHRADLLIHDCQYTEDEYSSHVGWGHPSVDPCRRVRATCRRRPARDVPSPSRPRGRRARRDARDVDRLRGGSTPDRCIVAAEGAEIEV